MCCVFICVYLMSKPIISHPFIKLIRSFVLENMFSFLFPLLQNVYFAWWANSACHNRLNTPPNCPYDRIPLMLLGFPAPWPLIQLRITFNRILSKTIRNTNQYTFSSTNQSINRFIQSINQSINCCCLGKPGFTTSPVILYGWLCPLENAQRRAATTTSHRPEEL